MSMAARAMPDMLAEQCDQRFVRYPHIRLIAQAIVESIFDPNIDCVIVRTPPRVGKSTIVNWVIVWLLDWFPTLPIITTSYAIRLSRRNSRRIRNIFKTYARKLRTRIADDQSAAEQWETEEGGGLLASAVNAALAGFDAAVLFVDDPHKSWAEAQSETIREGTWDWFESDAETRLMEYTVTFGGEEFTIYPTIVMVHTAFHPEDLSHRAQEKYSKMLDPDTGEYENRCRVIHIPALCDLDIVDPDPLGREPGESICEELQPAKRYRRLFAATSEFIVNALYQGIPKNIEGGMVNRAWWAWADEAPPPEDRLVTFTSWDLTFKETGKSWVVGQKWTITQSDADRNKLNFHLLDQIRRKAGFIDQRLILRSWAEKHPDAEYHLIEEAANGHTLLEDLTMEWVDTQAYDELGRRIKAVRSDTFTEKRWPAVHGLVPVPVSSAVGSKSQRLLKNAPTIRDGFVLLPSWWEPSSEPQYPGDKGDEAASKKKSDVDGVATSWMGLINECAEMPNGATDDVADCLSQAMSWGRDHVSLAADGSAQEATLQNPPVLARGRRGRR